MNTAMAKKPKSDNPWPERLLAWQTALKKTNDEMARLLNVPARTYIGWKYGERPPGRIAKTLIELLMEQTKTKK